MARYIDADKFEKEIKMEASDSIANAVIRIIDRQPTADVEEVKHGKWIEVFDLCGVKVLKCSICGLEHPRNKTAYCCDCGAKMDGGIAE